MSEPFFNKSPTGTEPAFNKYRKTMIAIIAFFGISFVGGIFFGDRSSQQNALDPWTSSCMDLTSSKYRGLKYSVDVFTDMFWSTPDHHTLLVTAREAQFQGRYGNLMCIFDVRSGRAVRVDFTPIDRPDHPLPPLQPPGCGVGAVCP